MVVPSGLADSLNVPSLMGAMGGSSLLQAANEGDTTGSAAKPAP
jgi:hypothetical protein